MVTASVIAGSSVAGFMVFTPVPGTAKWIRSGPPELGVELAAVIASRRLHPLVSQMPLPGSVVLLTVKVVAAWAGLAVIEKLAAVRIAMIAVISTKVLFVVVCVV